MNATGSIKARMIVAKACRLRAIRMFFRVSVQDCPRRAIVAAEIFADRVQTLS